MKKTVMILMALAMALCLSATALAETWYVKTENGKPVNIRNETGSKILGRIPYGTAVTPDEEKSTETSAYVTYNKLSGYVNWKYLVQEYPGEYQKGSAGKTAAEPETYGEGQYAISITGGVLQFPNKKGKAAGKKYGEVKFDEPTEVIATASVPKGKKVDYWLINGIKLKPAGKTLTLMGEDQDLTVEIVLKQ